MKIFKIILFLILGIFISLFILIASIPAISEISLYLHIKSTIPDKISTWGIEAYDHTPVITGGGDGGGVTFKLSKSTVKNIKKEKLSYFSSITPINKNNYWHAWQDIADSQKPGFISVFDSSMFGFEKKFGERASKELNQGHVYYTYTGSEKRNESLWVFPETGIIVYSFY